MPAPFYTSNPAEFTRVAGLYVVEVAPPGFIQGRNLNVIGIAGAAVRGPVDTPVEITSFQRFKDIFGGRDYGAGGSFVNELLKLFLAGPVGKVVCVRAAATAAAKASFTLETAADGAGTAVLKVEATSPGQWAGSASGGSATGVKVKVEAATDGTSGKFNLRVKYLGQVKLYENLDIRTGTDNTLTVVGSDLANWVTLTKLADGTPVTTGMSGLDTDGYITLGQTVASFTSVPGDDGTIADTDYTASGRALDKLAAYPGIGVALVAERANATIAGAIVTRAAAATDRAWLIWSGDHTDTPADLVTFQAALTRSDRVWHAANSPYIIDPDTATQIQVAPVLTLAVDVSQTAVNQHVGSNRTKAFNAAIQKLTNETWTREDYATLKAAGICGLERAANGSGFCFVDGVTTNLTAGLTEIARRREADFITLSMADRLQDFVKEEDTEDVQGEMAGEAVDFLDSLKRAKSIVKAFAVDQGDTVNTDQARAQGIEVLAVNVKFYNHILGLVLRVNAGTGVVVAEDAA